MISSRLAAAGSPLNAASTSSMQNVLRQGREPRNATREVMRLAGDVLFGQAFRRLIFQALANFVFERAQHGIQQGRGFHSDFGRMDQFLVKKAGKQKPEQNQW